MSEVLTDAGILSLAALPLTQDEDPCLPSGTHLRWNLSPALGFPHAGFRIRRRPSPAWPWTKDETLSFWFSRRNVATSAAGVHISNAPFRIEDAIVTPDFGLRCEQRKPMRFLYEQREQDDPNFEPWVRFAVVLESDQRWLRKQVRLRGFVRRGDSTVQVAEMRKQFRSLPVIPSVDDRVFLRVAFISASELHSVGLEFGAGIVLREIRYCTADWLHQQDNWETLAILSPLCQEYTPNVVSPTDLRQMAFERLRDMRPLRRPTDPAAPGKGKLISMRDHLLFARGLLREAETLAESISQAFIKEIEHKIPPGNIRVGDVDNSPMVQDDGREGSMNFPFYGLLQASAFESHIAAMLGLGYYDESGVQDSVEETERHDGWDYAVDAVVSSLWLDVGQMTAESRAGLNFERVPNALLAHGEDANVWETEPPGFKRLFACVVDQEPGQSQALPQPTLQAKIVPDATQKPVQASVAVTLVPNGSGVRPLLWRKDGRKFHPLSPMDPTTQLLSPALSNGQQFLTIYDNSLVQYGQARYQAANIDAFGRSSDTITASCLVKDLIAPPAPSSLEIELGEPDPDDDNKFPHANGQFRWSNAMADSAPDLKKLHIYWRSGFADEGAIVSHPDGKVSIDWPITENQRSERDNEGITLFKEFPLKTARDGFRRQVSAICLAEDEAGNFSPPSQAVQVILVDEIKPSPPLQPDEPQWTSWPDANKEVRWRCRWTLPNNARAARISSASETRLLNLADIDKEAHYALSAGERAQALKQIAVSTPQAFVPEALGYPSEITHHDVVMKAGRRDYKVVVVEFIGATGQKSLWPSDSNCFAVIRARTLEPLPVPTLQVELDNQQASIHTLSNGRGDIEIYAVYGLSDVAKIEFQSPIAIMAVDQLSDIQHQPDPNADWVGYISRLSHPDGRYSDFSPPVWRELR